MDYLHKSQGHTQSKTVKESKVTFGAKRERERRRCVRCGRCTASAAEGPTLTANNHVVKAKKSLVNVKTCLKQTHIHETGAYGLRGKMGSLWNQQRRVSDRSKNWHSAKQTLKCFQGISVGGDWSFGGYGQWKGWWGKQSYTSLLRCDNQQGVFCPYGTLIWTQAGTLYTTLYSACSSLANSVECEDRDLIYAIMVKKIIFYSYLHNAKNHLIDFKMKSQCVLETQRMSRWWNTACWRQEQ